MNDFISISLEGTVINTPVRQGDNYGFELVNERNGFVAKFKVFVKNDPRPIDVNKGDRVSIINAGFYVKNGVNHIAVIESSSLSVQRIRCNYGEKEV